MARNPSTNTGGQPFDDKATQAAWRKGTPEANLPGFRKDTCGAGTQRTKYGKTERWSWETDRVKAAAKSNMGDLSNLQPLQWENTRHKGTAQG
jgi:hypothetical protein